jgi:Electron transfer DM13
MNKLSIVLLVIALISCQEENNTPTTPVNNTFDINNATLLKQGMLMGIGGHTVSGTASIYEQEGKKYVVLDPYSSQNGPDLKVYLSTTVNASSYINLGALKSITGTQVYAVPGNPDLDEYPYVHIWCEQFSVEFGRAEVL